MKQTRPYPIYTVSRKAEHSLSLGHPWVYAEEVAAPPEEKPRRERRRSFILKDVRVFLNTLSHSLDVMKKGGIDAGYRQEETEDELIVTISIPKKKP